MKKEETALTPRQQATYDLIVKNSEIGNPTTQKEICDNYSFDANERKDGYVWNDSTKAHDHCTTVWSDINAINNNSKTKIIVYSDFVYWVAKNKKEVKDFVNSLYLTKALAALKRRDNLLKKADKDGAIDLFDVQFAFEPFITDLLKACGVDENGDDA